MPTLSEISGLYVGTGAVSRLYVGAEQVWPATSTPQPMSATWAFTGSSTSGTTTGAGVTAPAYTIGAGTRVTLNSANTQTYSTTPVMEHMTTVAATTAAAAITSNTWVEYTVTRTGPWTPTQLTFKVAKGGTSTGRGYVVRDSRDNFAANVATAAPTNVRPTFATVTLDLTPVGQVASTYRVRIYTYCPSTTVSMDYDDISVTGTYLA